MKLKFIALFWLFLFTINAAFGQTRSALFDQEAYNNLPRKAELATRAYEGLPRAFSLKLFAPLPGDQDSFGTCVGWASAYAARTIAESFVLNRRNQTETTRQVFSPNYIYRNIVPEDHSGQMGAYIFDALDWMRDSGAVRMLDIERSLLFPSIELSLFKDSRKYPIAGYVTLFSSDDDEFKSLLAIRAVKKSLSEGKPVIIGMSTPDSFVEARGVWEPYEEPGYFYYGHAMCVVGYDDERYGGAFEVMNSWGRSWGNGGFMWIPYSAFTNFVREAYEITENLAIFSDTVKFNGYSRIEFPSLPESSAALLPFPVSDIFNVYKTARTYGEGSQFRFIMGARESAYVYAFAVSEPTDGGGSFYSPTQLFPQPGYSPLLNYSESEVIIPGEDRTFSLDGNAGLEYFIMLQAKQALDIQAIMRNFESARGSLEARLTKALEPYNPAIFSGPSPAEALLNGAEFAIELNDPMAVAVLVVVIDHI